MTTGVEIYPFSFEVIMNIFVTDYNPMRASQNLCDIHVVKMVLESAQMLCTYLNEEGLITPYKSTHKNHPCSLWLKESWRNRNWLYEHFRGLIFEYEFRYNKTHKCKELMYLFVKNFEYPPVNEYINPLEPIEFTLCMPEEYKQDNSIEAYKRYYQSKQYTMKRKMKWTKREKPEFMEN